MDPDVPYLDKIKRLIINVVEDYERNHVLVIFTEFWLLLKLKGEHLNHSLEQGLTEIRLMFADLIKGAVANGEIKKIDHEILSSILFGLVEAMFLEKAWNKEMQLDAHLQAVCLLLDGLKV